MDLKLLGYFCKIVCKMKKFLCIVLYVVTFYIKMKFGFDKKDINDVETHKYKNLKRLDTGDFGEFGDFGDFGEFGEFGEFGDTEYGQYCDIEICDNC